MTEERLKEIAQSQESEDSMAVAELIAEVRRLQIRVLEWEEGFNKLVAERLDDMSARMAQAHFIRENQSLRSALKELVSMVRTHEAAIRADFGNTNWEVFHEKARAALGDKP